MDTAIINLLHCGSTIVTPNNRLSAEWIEGYFIARSQKTLEKPQCLPYKTFLRQLYQSVSFKYPEHDHPLILSPIQKNALWNQLLQSEQLPSSDGFLHEINSAWTKVNQWQVNLSDSSFEQSQQTQLFQTLTQAFHKRLRQLNAITDEQLAHYLQPWLKHLPAQTIIWACFDSLTPEQEAIQQALNQCQHQSYDLPLTLTKPVLLSATDEQQELSQLCLWLKERLIKGDQKIGVVIPSLANLSASIARQLSLTLNASFNLSLGHTLYDYPLVNHALMLLNFPHNSLSSFDTKLLLKTPFIIDSDDECLKRAQLLQHSPILCEPQIPIDKLIEILAHESPRLAERLSTIEPYPENASPFEWVSLFKQHLVHLGFPGQYSLNSENYQCYQRFIHLIEALTELNIITPTLTKTAALEHLQQMARQTVFQPKKGAVRIHVLGMLEASGCPFDSLWVMGLTNQCLPAKGHPSPFIPLSLQRSLNMPHANPQRELFLANTIIERFKRASGECVLSYPALTGDISNLPSPLIGSLPAFKPLLCPPEPLRMIEYFEDEYLIPITDISAIKGGTALLANQAKCPFKAFVAHRLHGQKKPSQVDGIDALTRGQLIHKIMEIFWQSIKSQAQLLVLSDSQLTQQIEDAINKTLLPFHQRQPHTFNELTQQVERSRLKSLIVQAISFEKQRPSFQIDTLESAFTINLAGIDFNVRVDRIDATTDDKKWVIDYKSRLPVKKPWAEERPEEPQLLLYALLDKHINTLLFIELNKGQLSLSGFSEEEEGVKGIQCKKASDPWQSYQARWQTQLQALAEEFIAGQTRPSPAREGLCQQCDFINFCRYPRG